MQRLLSGKLPTSSLLGPLLVPVQVNELSFLSAHPAYHTISITEEGPQSKHDIYHPPTTCKVISCPSHILVTFSYCSLPSYAPGIILLILSMKLLCPGMESQAPNVVGWAKNLTNRPVLST